MVGFVLKPWIKRCREFNFTSCQLPIDHVLDFATAVLIFYLSFRLLPSAVQNLRLNDRSNLYLASSPPHSFVPFLHIWVLIEMWKVEGYQTVKNVFITSPPTDQGLYIANPECFVFESVGQQILLLTILRWLCINFAVAFMKLSESVWEWNGLSRPRLTEKILRKENNR